MGVNVRGLVYSKFKNITEFALAAEWSRNKASRIVNGEQDPSLDDICVLTRVLNIETQQAFIDIFFAPLSTMWTDKGAEVRE